MTHEETTALVRRANASGFESIAEYAVALERALVRIAEQSSQIRNEAVLIARDTLFREAA